MGISTMLLTKMREKGITQYRLAEQAGYAQSYISQICAGKRTPTIGALTRISECLDVPVRIFLEDDWSGGEALTAQESRLLALFRALDKRNREILSSIAEQMYVAQSVCGKRMEREEKSLEKMEIEME